MELFKGKLKKVTLSAGYFGRMSLKTKIIGLIMIATILIIISGMLNFFSNRYFMSEYFSIHERLLTISTILDDAFNMLPLIREYASDPLLKENRNKYENYKKEIETAVYQIMINYKDVDDQHKFFENDITLYLKMCDDILDASDRNDQTVRTTYNKISLQADNVKRSAIDLTMQELNYGNDVRKEINNKINTIYFASTTVVIILITLVFILISMTMKRIISSLKELEDLSQKVTQGEYDLQEIKIKGNDEIGLLEGAFNEMVHSLRLAYNEIDKRQNELKALNRNLTDTNKQLIKTNKDLKDAQEQIIQSEKMASLGSLVAGVSHEVNTPIGVSVTAASFLSEKNKELCDKANNSTLTKREFEDYLRVYTETSEIILSNLRRASELIGSFKMIAVDQTSEECREIMLKNYIEDVILSLKHVLKKTLIEISLQFEDEDLKIKTYPGSLAQVFTNLIMNSVIHGFEDTKKGTITISTRINGRNLIIQYCDDGKGIEKEVLKRIFEPFYTTKRGLGGSGLGLFIVYNIVTKHIKGSIDCESNVGEGVLFTIKIPLTL